MPSTLTSKSFVGTSAAEMLHYMHGLMLIKDHIITSHSQHIITTMPYLWLFMTEESCTTCVLFKVSAPNRMYWQNM